MCTDFILPFDKKGKTPTCISGRTVDFSDSPTEYYATSVIKVPVGKTFVADAPGEGGDDKKGKGKGHQWTTKYGFVGFTFTAKPKESDSAKEKKKVEKQLKQQQELQDEMMAEKNFYCDGLNTEGFSAATLWYSYSKFNEVHQQAAKDKSYLDMENIIAFLLGNCKNVKEALELLKSVNVWVQKDFAATYPLHLSIHDKAGHSLVVEFINNEAVYYDNNDIGALANGPDFAWQSVNYNYFYNALTNKDNCVDKSVEFAKEKPSNLLKAVPGNGMQYEVLASGMFGLPGDSSSPSRFVKAGKLSKCVPTDFNGRNGVQYALQVLGRITVCEQEVLLYFEDGDTPFKTRNTYNPTLWKAVRDHTNRILYFSTHLNHNLQAVKLDQLDFSKGSPITKTSIFEEDNWYTDSSSKLN
ncbi:MAG: linear amide C-N hydrolase [bacterium]|nr:linear amide C-N hydrolase [bacterium]